MLYSKDPRFRLLYIWILYQLDESSETDKLGSQYINIFPDTEGSRSIQAVRYAKNGKQNEVLALDLKPENKMMIYLYLKKSDKVLQLVNNLYSWDTRSERTHYLTMKYHPLNDFLQSDPRFQEILAAHKRIYEKNLSKYGDGEDLIN